ncbi:AAA family ATPase [Candidatus Daviesbacteria bacterium]|nr:AAA family ATPase [Candidatus Daviesbacteria bacterium]
MKLVIGLVGEKGSGKETFVKFLKNILVNKNIAHLRFSDLLKETLKLWGIPITRVNLQHLAVVMDRGFGDGTLAYATLKRIESIKANIIVLDGVRWQKDVELLKSFSNNLLIYVTAPLRIRYQRLKKRGEKTGEETSSFKQFLKEERAKNELLIPKIGTKADYKIVNDGVLNKFKKSVALFAKKLN